MPNAFGPTSFRAVLPSDSMNLNVIHILVSSFSFVCKIYYVTSACSFLYHVIEPSLLGAPFRRESSFSEFDEVKRRFLIVNPSQDLRYQGSSEPPLLSRSPAFPIQPQGGWLVEEDINRGQFNNRKSGTVQESCALIADNRRACQNLPFHVALRFCFCTITVTGI